MGVIPLQAAHSGRNSDHCGLCAEAARRDNAIAETIDKLRQVVPFALITVLGVLIAVLDRGLLGVVGLGMVAGTFTGAAYVAARRRGFERAVEEAHAAELKAISDDADGRVQAVITQFEWVVNDVAQLRTRLEDSEAQVRTLTERNRAREHQNEQLVRQISRLRERLAEIAMNASMAEAGKAMRAPLFEAVAFTWSLRHEGTHARLELGTPATDPNATRVRITDRAGQVVAASAVGVLTVEGNIEFQVEPTLELVGELEAGRELSYEIEALVGDEWRRVRLQDGGRRAKTVVDGRMLRASDTIDVVQVATLPARRSLN